MEIIDAVKKIGQNIDNSDKVFFTRKVKELKELVELVNAYTQQIYVIEEAKFAKVIELNELRKSIVSRCTHPEDFLEKMNENVFFCSFCDTTLNIID